MESSNIADVDRAAIETVHNLKDIEPFPPGAPGEVEIRLTFDCYPPERDAASTEPPPGKRTTWKSPSDDLIQQAWRAEWVSDFNRAIPLYMKALHGCTDREKEQIRDGLAASHCGVAKKREANPEEAKRLLHQALLYKSDHKDSQKELRRLIERLGKDPDSFEDRVSLGDEAAGNGDVPGAVVEYLEALKIKNDPALRRKVEGLGGRPGIAEWVVLPAEKSAR